MTIGAQTAISLPQARASMFCIERFFPQWRNLSSHESSPVSISSILALLASLGLILLATMLLFRLLLKNASRARRI